MFGCVICFHCLSPKYLVAEVSHDIYALHRPKGGRLSGTFTITPWIQPRQNTEEMGTQR